MSFKKNVITQSVAAAIGVLGLAGAAQAVNVNPNGLGEVLIYPYYTSRNNQATAFSIVNTTNVAKAVKVRFLEGKGSIEVLDFNLYLSPNDVWTGLVSDNGTGAQLLSSDGSCTAPVLATSLGGPGKVSFRNTNTRNDLAGADLDRTREGYLEIIEMGEVTNYALASGDAFDAAVTHGATFNCDAVTAAFGTAGVGGLPAVGDLSAPTGGLMGAAHIVGLNDGLDISYEPVALDNWSDRTNLHSSPGSESPGLDRVRPLTSNVFTSGNASVVQSSWAGSPTAIDSVSAVLMHSALVNEYITEPQLLAGTDWIVTFPTKRYHVDGLGVAATLRPFDAKWVDATGSCEVVTPLIWDRDEAEKTTGIDFSPVSGPPGTNLCYEVNVMRFGDAGAANSNVLGSVTRPVGLAMNLANADIFTNGWMRLGFAEATQTMTDTNTAPVFADRFTYQGLPAVGFAAIRYAAGSGTALGHYGSAFSHKGEQGITSVAVP